MASKGDRLLATETSTETPPRLDRLRSPGQIREYLLFDFVEIVVERFFDVLGIFPIEGQHVKNLQFGMVLDGELDRLSHGPIRKL